MRDDIHCLMTAGVSLTRRACDALFDTACQIIKDGRKKQAVRDDGIEGEIRTEFEEQVLGSIGGVEFHATVETEMGTGKVKFLVRPADAKRRNELEWTTFPSMEALEAELNSPPSRRTPAYN